MGWGDTAGTPEMGGWHRHSWDPPKAHWDPQGTLIPPRADGHTYLWSQIKDSGLRNAAFSSVGGGAVGGLGDGSQVGSGGVGEASRVLREIWGSWADLGMSWEWGRGPLIWGSLVHFF